MAENQTDRSESSQPSINPKDGLSHAPTLHQVHNQQHQEQLQQEHYDEQKLHTPLDGKGSEFKMVPPTEVSTIANADIVNASTASSGSRFHPYSQTKVISMDKVQKKVISMDKARFTNSYRSAQQAFPTDVDQFEQKLIDYAKKNVHLTLTDEYVRLGKWYWNVKKRNGHLKIEKRSSQPLAKPKDPEILDIARQARELSAENTLLTPWSFPEDLANNTQYWELRQSLEN